MTTPDSDNASADALETPATPPVETPEGTASNGRIKPYPLKITIADQVSDVERELFEKLNKYMEAEKEAIRPTVDASLSKVSNPEAYSEDYRNQAAVRMVCSLIRLLTDASNQFCFWEALAKQARADVEKGLISDKDAKQLETRADFEIRRPERHKALGCNPPDRNSSKPLPKSQTKRPPILLNASVGSIKSQIHSMVWSVAPKKGKPPPNLINMTEAGLSRAGEAYAMAFLEKQTPFLIKSQQILQTIADIAQRSKQPTFLHHWGAEGSFESSASVIINDEDIAMCRQLLATAIRAFMDGRSEFREDNKDGSVEPLIAAAVDRLIERMQVGETPALMTKEEQRRRHNQVAARANREKETAAALRQRQEDEAREARQIAEQEAHLAFMAKPQPFIMSDLSQKLLSELEGYAGAAGPYASNAAALLNMVRHTQSQLDIRGNGIKELGSLLFSADNLGVLAKVCGIDLMDGSKTSSQHNVTETASKLRQLYLASADVRRVVDTLMHQEYGIIQLATLTRNQQHCKNYVGILTESPKEIALLEEKVNATRAVLESFSPEERAALGGDVRQYETLASELAEKKARFNIQKIHAELAEEISEIFKGRRIRKIADHPIPKSERAKALEIPEAWLTILNGNFQIERKDETHLAIHSVEFPDISATVKRGSLNDVIERTVHSLNGRCAQRIARNELLQHLGNDCGFQINEATLRHPEYGIMIELSDRENIFDALQTAESEFKKHQEAQTLLIDKAHKAGFTVSMAQGQLRLSHKVFGEIVAPRGYLADQEMQKLDAWIEHVPRADQTMICFDNCTLEKLEAQRNGGDATWLDLVKETAKLPNVKVIIPAVIADWEMRGKIAVYDKRGRRSSFEQIDTRFRRSGHKLHLIASNMDNFLESASRARINEDGTVHFDPGGNPNVIIMETAGDRELYNQLHDMHSLPHEEQVRRHAEEIRGHNDGEKAISRILETLPFNTSFMIVSDDMGYQKKEVPHTTPGGKAVGQCSTLTYLKAELEARPAELCHALHEVNLNTDRVCDRIKAYWDKYGGYGRSGMFPFSRSGVDAKGHKGETMSELVESGCQAEKRMASPEIPPAQETPSGNGKKWTDENALRPLRFNAAASGREHNNDGAGRSVG
jgi:hypothetical protein